jgi:hypothetical protein
MRWLARWGLATRALIYLLIGYLALRLAFGHYGRETDQRGALQEVASRTGGRLVLWIALIGLVGYALWRFSEAAFGAVGDPGSTSARVRSFVRGVIYLFFAVSTFQLLTHSSKHSQAGQQELWTARALRHDAGRWVVGIAGAVVVVAGLVQIYEGATKRFAKYLNFQSASTGTRHAVIRLGQVGTIARGVVFALAGGFVIQAAWHADPQKSRGLDGALRTLAASSNGRWALMAIAIGLLAFGVYGFAEARWRRT